MTSNNLIAMQILKQDVNNSKDHKLDMATFHGSQRLAHLSTAWDAGELIF